MTLKEKHIMTKQYHGKNFPLNHPHNIPKNLKNPIQHPKHLNSSISPPPEKNDVGFLWAKSTWSQTSFNGFSFQMWIKHLPSAIGAGACCCPCRLLIWQSWGCLHGTNGDGSNFCLDTRVFFRWYKIPTMKFELPGWIFGMILFFVLDKHHLQMLVEACFSIKSKWSMEETWPP